MDVDYIQWNQRCKPAQLDQFSNAILLNCILILSCWLVENRHHIMRHGIRIQIMKSVRLEGMKWPDVDVLKLST